jgi:fatty-acyl-CoA synthase
MTGIHDHSDRPYEWIGGLSERRARLSPDRIGLVDADTGEEYSYADLDRRANRTARLLGESAVGEGDRVAVVSRNRPELVDLYFATAKVGAILAPLSFRLSPRELGEMLADIEPRLLVVEPRFAAEIQQALDDSELTADEVTTLTLPAEDGSQQNGTDFEEWTSYQQRLPDDGSPVERADVALSDPHLFLHTGGSTGLPKQVVLTHGGIIWNAFNTIISWGLRDNDVTPMVFPMFHTGGWNVLTIPFFHLGGTVIIAREFDAGQVLSLVEAHRATVLVSVPAILRFMADHDDWESTDLSSLRLVKSGGGPAREAVVDAWRERGITPSQGYGLTECGPNNFAMPDTYPREKTETIGQPALYVDARIVDDDGTELPQGEVGELELASPHASNSYWRRPDESEKTFGDGWVSTGDLARVDEDGYYSIEGRKKNMFVSGGENVYPPEVEDVLTDHPKVTEAIVVPIDDETWGQVGKAVVEGDDSLTLDELQAFAADRLAKFKIPKALVFVGEMPMSGPGKIDRQRLTEEYGSA